MRDTFTIFYVLNYKLLLLLFCFIFLFLCRYYINYKLMKKKVKQYAQQMEVGTQDRRHVLKDFSRMLDNQVCIAHPFSCEELINASISDGVCREFLCHACHLKICY